MVAMVSEGYKLKIAFTTASKMTLALGEVKYYKKIANTQEPRGVTTGVTDLERP